MAEFQDVTYSRRKILTQGLVAAAALVTAQPAMASVGTPWSFFRFGRRNAPRTLSFEHLHTGERLVITYAENGRYIPDALYEINYLLRDFRLNAIHSIDPALLDVLHDVHAMLETNAPFQVVSGYRSPVTNNKLRAHSHNVAQNSYHIRGQAIDVCVPGRTPLQLRNAALTLRQGGVGYYPEGFVHIDTGPLRTWQS